MHTEIVVVNGVETEKLKAPAKALREGKLVAFPTETVYGLGANALDEKAVKSIFEAKGRPADNPLIVHITDKADIEKLAREIPENAMLILDEFSPGPVTVILKKQPHISNVVTGGLDTVAIRIPEHPVARELITQSGVPVAAPSANLSGLPSPTKAEHVIDDMNGRIPYIIDGGACGVGVESTVVDVTGEYPVILRPGKVTLEDIQRIIPETIVDPHVLDIAMRAEKPRSPGMKYKHYAPKAEVVVVEGEADKVIGKIQELCAVAKAEGKRVGVMLKYGNGNSYDADYILEAGADNDKYAAMLFSDLREFDNNNIDIVFAEFKNEDGMGLTVRNRLYRAAANNVINV